MSSIFGMEELIMELLSLVSIIGTYWWFMISCSFSRRCNEQLDKDSLITEFLLCKILTSQLSFTWKYTGCSIQKDVQRNIFSLHYNSKTFTALQLLVNLTCESVFQLWSAQNKVNHSLVNPMQSSNVWGLLQN